MATATGQRFGARKGYDLWLFFLLAFAIAWIPWIWTAAAGSGPLLVGAVSPTVAALVAASLAFGRGGIATVMRRLAKWRVSARLYLIAALWGAFLMGTGLIFLLAVGTPAEAMVFAPLPRWILGVLIFLPIFITLEEVGWRGFALPRLQTRMSALNASLLLGLIHGLWHLPLFWIPEAGMGEFSVASLLLFLAGIIAGAILLTFLFNSSGGSLLPVIIAHASYNLFVNGVTLPPDIKPVYDAVTVVVASAVAAGLIWRYGPANLSPHDRSTYPEDHQR